MDQRQILEMYQFLREKNQSIPSETLDWMLDACRNQAKIDERNELYRKAFKLWGVEAQKGMIIEEVGELLTAMNHYDRGRCDLGEVVEEMADVYIMMEEFKEYYGDVFDFFLDRKFLKFKSQLNKSEVDREPNDYPEEPKKSIAQQCHDNAVEKIGNV